MPVLLDPPTAPPRAAAKDASRADPEAPPVSDGRAAATPQADPADVRLGWSGVPVPLVLPRRVTEIDPFLAWCASDDFPDGLSASLIDGNLYLAPAVDDPYPHNLLKSAVLVALTLYGRETDLGEAFGDGLKYAHTPDGLGHEPDASFNLYESYRTGRVTIAPPAAGGTKEVMTGRPDLLVECLSDGSVEKDLNRLRRAYLAGGVREYWILDGRDGRADFTLLSRADDATDWSEAIADADGLRLSDVLDRRVRLERGTNPMGRPKWNVRLEPAA